jgi:hypothetical protein
MYDMIAYVVTAIVIILGYFGLLRKVKSLLDMLREVGELLITLVSAMEDDRIDEDEVKKIIKEGRDVIEKVKEIIG